MKITLQALNVKIAVIDDLSADVSQHKQYLATSEGKRNGLQDELAEAARKIEKDGASHEERHDKSMKEIEDLRAQLLQL